MKKSILLASASFAVGPMSAQERAAGRYLRAEEGHAAAPVAAPAAEAEPVVEEDPLARFIDPNEPDSGTVEPATPPVEGKAEEEGVEPKPEAEPKGKPVQERIDELTASRREAERVAAESARQAEYWRGKAEALEQPKGETKVNVDPEAEPAPANYEFGEVDPEYTRDLARFTARQEFREQERQSNLKGALATLDAKWTETSAAPDILEAYPDFEEKVTKGGAKNEWACPPLIALGLKDSEVGPHIAYELASNPARSREIAQMSTIEQAREFGRLEGKHLAAREAKKAGGIPAKVDPAAPAPPSARTRGAGGKFGVEADTDDFGAFKKMANEVLAGKR